MTALADQLTDIRGKVDNFVTDQSKENSSLNLVMDWKNNKPIERPNDEESYNNHLRNLRNFTKDIKKIFTGEAEGGVPLNIRVNLDRYNELTDYSEYADENSVLLKVDALFNDVTKLFTKSARITLMADRHSAITDIESKVTYALQGLTSLKTANREELRAKIVAEKERLQK